MKTKIEDLREHLFATLEALRDEEKPMDLDRARTISVVAQTIINSAKVEVEFAEVTGRTTGSDFLDQGERKPLPKPGPKLVGAGEA